MKINLLALCDGIGGAAVALQKAGFEIATYYSSEIDEQAQQVVSRHFPNVIHLGDIYGVTADMVSDVDIIVAGPPCQSFSTLGSGKGFNAATGDVFNEVFRILDAVKPRFFLIENVKMTNENAAIISRKLGIAPIELNAADFSAQNRPRLYWTNIGAQSAGGFFDFSVPGIAPPLIRNRATMTDILEVVSDEKYYLSDAALVGLRRRLTKFKHRNFPYSLKSRKCGTILKTYSKRQTTTTFPVQNGRLRTLTPTEVEVLQGYPKGYTAGFSDTRRYGMLGNSFQIDTVAYIFSHIKKNKL